MSLFGKVVTKWIDRLWYDRKFPARYLFLPLSWVFIVAVSVRRYAYAKRWLSSDSLACPVIVVGNITVGGTGKTPVVVWLVNLLIEAGYKPGVISRGYGGGSGSWPRVVDEHSCSEDVGDEAVLIYRRTGAPMVVGPDRIAAANQLLAANPCDVIISDDGLQHYRLQRDIEIAVIDGVRRFGNKCCLPAGPLREPVSRLSEVDFIITNGLPQKNEEGLRLEGDEAIQLNNSENRQFLSHLASKKVHAVAGIGNPRRFFDYLKRFGLSFTEHIFPDHHRYHSSELNFEGDIILMTEKDAVKCLDFADERYWYVPIRAKLSDGFANRLLARIKEKVNGS